jgi:2'-5' RNA ligase
MSARQGTVRLFFAAVPDAATRARIGAAADALELQPSSRRVPGDNYHATIAFVGALPMPMTPIVREIGSARRSQPFSLHFDAYDYWPTPGVVVALARAVPAPLAALWQDLHEALGEHGFARDRESLRPHVTLARKVSQAPVAQEMSAFDWTVTEFVLMRSDRSDSQSAYTVVDTWQLLYD